MIICQELCLIYGIRSVVIQPNSARWFGTHRGPIGIKHV